jgi:hypothetical protein
LLSRRVAILWRRWVSLKIAIRACSAFSAVAEPSPSPAVEIDEPADRHAYSGVGKCVERVASDGRGPAFRDSLGVPDVTRKTDGNLGEPGTGGWFRRYLLISGSVTVMRSSVSRIINA